VLALQEGAAIGMAGGFAQATGRPALVNLHAAAGTGNAMGNLVNTQAGHVPVIVTSGNQARKYTEVKAYLTNVDAPRLVEPLVKWSHEPARRTPRSPCRTRSCRRPPRRPGRYTSRCR
jgi:benzoylformate decarboxylase